MDYDSNKHNSPQLIIILAILLIMTITATIINLIITILMIILNIITIIGTLIVTLSPLSLPLASSHFHHYHYHQHRLPMTIFKLFGQSLNRRIFRGTTHINSHPPISIYTLSHNQPCSFCSLKRLLHVLLWWVRRIIRDCFQSSNLTLSVE